MNLSSGQSHKARSGNGSGFVLCALEQAPQNALYLHSIHAGHMLRRLHELARSGNSFAFESTLSSRTFAKFLRDCKATGYQVVLFYVTLPTSDLAVQRVALRVKQGGHNIPTEDIHRRFQRSLINLFELYLPLSDRWSVLDNASGRLATIAAGTLRRTSVKDSEKWLLLRSIAS